MTNYFTPDYFEMYAEGIPVLGCSSCRIIYCMSEHDSKTSFEMYTIRVIDFYHGGQYFYTSIEVPTINQTCFPAIFCYIPQWHCS